MKDVDKDYELAIGIQGVSLISSKKTVLNQSTGQVKTRVRPSSILCLRYDYNMFCFSGKNLHVFYSLLRRLQQVLVEARVPYNELNLDQWKFGHNKINVTFNNQVRYRDPCLNPKQSITSYLYVDIEFSLFLLSKSIHFLQIEPTHSQAFELHTKSTLTIRQSIESYMIDLEQVEICTCTTVDNAHFSHKFVVIKYRKNIF